MNERERRIAENEALFRSVNDQIATLGGKNTASPELMQVVCECGTQRCTERIPVAPAEFAEVRADPTRFIVKPGHDFPETEVAVDKNERFWTVQKRAGEPAEIARRAEAS